MPQIIKTVQLKLKNNHFNPIYHISHLYLSHQEALFNGSLQPGEEIILNVPIRSLGAMDDGNHKPFKMTVHHSYGHIKTFKVFYPEGANIIAIEWNQHADSYEAKLIEWLDCTQRFSCVYSCIQKSITLVMDFNFFKK